MTNFEDMCNDCGNKIYSKYKPFRDLGAITMSKGKCPKCGKDTVIIYAIDWATMCRKTNYFD